MNWSETFKNYIESYTYLDKLDNDSIIDNIKNTLKSDTSVKEYRLFDIKLKTNWIRSNDFSIYTNYFNGEENFTLNIVDTNLEHKNIKWIFENYYGKKIDIPINKMFVSENFKINKVKFDKIKYFMEYNHKNNIEYIKFNPDYNNKMEIKRLLLRSNIKLLMKPAICQSNTILTFKLEGIIIDYNPKEVFKYEFIKKIFDARKIRNRENFIEHIEKIKEDRVIIDSRFNKYKFNKNKLKESNNKILEILS